MLVASAAARVKTLGDRIRAKKQQTNNQTKPNFGRLRRTGNKDGDYARELVHQIKGYDNRVR